MVASHSNTVCSKTPTPTNAQPPHPPVGANPQQFPGLPQSKTKPPSNSRNSLSLSVPAFTTLPEAGVKGPGAVQIQAIHDWLQTQVNHLVEAELAAVNGCSFGLQGDKELLWTFGWYQPGLGKEEREVDDGIIICNHQQSLNMLLFIKKNSHHIYCISLALDGERLH